MPLIKSAKKALRVSQRRKLENDLIRAKIKNAVKGAKLSITAKKADVTTKIDSLYKELDLASKKNVIHRNKAARLKSRITKAANKASLVEPKATSKKTTKTKKATS